MSNTLTIRLPEELLERLRKKSRRTGIPVGRVVRQSLEATLRPEGSDRKHVWEKYAGILEDGPPQSLFAQGIFARMTLTVSHTQWILFPPKSQADCVTIIINE
jgi:Ribbon-helix-helix domain